ncbi:hypothetical protein F5890DRAFT_1477786 [Lentinula detonsa]|uniref:Uncharacterized protein n=1 Tax=Lentinula detonsa TaxID=2804962 RepID=A0AA38UMZ4_9AGAR|nr:hypothetical protein F5890DRAFT_1477786 [Lentinula detonsa]
MGEREVETPRSVKRKRPIKMIAKNGNYPDPTSDRDAGEDDENVGSPSQPRSACTRHASLAMCRGNGAVGSGTTPLDDCEENGPSWRMIYIEDPPRGLRRESLPVLKSRSSWPCSRDKISSWLELPVARWKFKRRF